MVTKNTGNYWKPGRGNFNSIELQYIPDSASRLQGLISGQVDAINRLDPKTMDIMTSSPDASVVQSKGTGNRFAFVALCDVDPYSNVDTRLALKYGIDRKKIVDTVYQGYATIGNDTTISPLNKYYAKDVPQTVPMIPTRHCSTTKRRAARSWSSRSLKAPIRVRPTPACSIKNR